MIVDAVSEWFHRQFYRVWDRLPEPVQVALVGAFTMGIMVCGFVYLLALIATATETHP